MSMFSGVWRRVGFAYGGRQIRRHAKPIKNQQQPRQKLPCSNPIPNAPPRPGRQLCTKKPIGERQRRKQMPLIGVNCHTPAASRIAPPSE
jgi:hypothetical protein